MRPYGTSVCGLKVLFSIMKSVILNIPHKMSMKSVLLNIRHTITKKFYTTCYMIDDNRKNARKLGAQLL
jgi:hypothetical protein